MSIVVFIGPTLRVEAARKILDADYRPPAAQGDVYRAAQNRPWGIAIVDGYFEQVPAVWHKEILWAMSQGVHVFGASSMGALRAAELHSFGMIGVGAIFEAYRDGELMDDDEVTIVHADTDADCKPLSVAMVDIRATLSRALKLGVIDASEKAQCIELAKHCHYAERSYPKLCQDAIRSGMRCERAQELRAWFLAHSLSVKREDAQLLLRSLAHWRDRYPHRHSASFELEHTDAWHKLTRRIEATVARSDVPDTHPGILEALRLRPELHRKITSAALIRKLALMLFAQLGLELDSDCNAIERFRRNRALHSGQAAPTWMSENEVDRDGFVALARREAQVRLVAEALGRDLEAELIDELRTTGAYAELAAAARATLEQAGLVAAHRTSKDSLDAH